MDHTGFLRSTAYIDCDDASVIAFARAAIQGANDDIERAVGLYLTVRDDIVYDPYVDFNDAANFRASGVLRARRGFCIGKAALLVACARAVGIPARVGYADVRNHMTSRRLYEMTKSDVFRWHSYADLYLDGAWAKATPAFDAPLCQRVGISPLAFDGRSDSLFQSFDDAGRRRMEYLIDRGTFADVPFETIMADFRIHYPAMLAQTNITGDFTAEALAGNIADKVTQTP